MHTALNGGEGQEECNHPSSVRPSITALETAGGT